MAICLLHSYANPEHERRWPLRCGPRCRVWAVGEPRVLPEIKEYPRTSTTVVNAYVQPVVRAYIAAMAARLKALGIDAPLHLMQSNGGLASAEHAAEFPVRIIESGPAAGVVGAAALAKALGGGAARHLRHGRYHCESQDWWSTARCCAPKRWR